MEHGIKVQFSVVTLFPEMFTALDYGIVGRAQKDGIISLSLYNPRDYSKDKQHSVDDRPFGGGPGMVMMAQPLRDAIHAAKEKAQAKVIYLSPQGQPFVQRTAQAWSKESALILVAGRYEGIDQRIIDTEIDAEWSVGDYVLMGGELPSMIIIESITRLLPGVLGDAESACQDSFTNGLLDCPHYTRPEEDEGLKVPDVLLSGHHQKVAMFRRQQLLGQTWLKRPDLLTQAVLTDEDKRLLNAFMNEYRSSK